jgi:hypothetical protein
MKKLFSVVMVFIMLSSLLVTTASAAPAALLTQTPELGQLKVCKVAGSGVPEGTFFTFRVGNNTYNVPAGPANRNGFCVLAGQYPVNAEITIEEIIPSSYYVSQIEVKPDRTVSKDTAQGTVTVRIVSGVIEVIFTNNMDDSPTPTSTPTKTATPTPNCDPNCPPTATSIPMGRVQICKEAEDPGVTGSFTFRFETRSRSVPVGACAGLIAVNAGTLTITEDPRAEFSVADIYTIPADRLISKDLKAGKVTVRILEGTAASQTIVIFRNRTVITNTATPTFTPTATSTLFTHTPTSTPTGATPTFTPTATPTEVVCEPTTIYADFNKINVGDSIEGAGTVAPYLTIKAKRNAVKIAQEVDNPFAYLAPNDLGFSNGGMVAGGGFSDVDTKNAGEAHEYTFTFDQGISVSDFSLHMLDFGDLNMPLTLPPTTNHYVSMEAFDAGGTRIDLDELSYTTPAIRNPRESSQYGDLRINGDAVSAPHGMPGNWTWHVAGPGIRTVVLKFGEGFDPNVAFDLLYFTVHTACMCPASQTIDFAADFSKVGIGQSVEGLGTVSRYLNINGKGNAVRVAQALPMTQMAYLSPNDLPFVNSGLVGYGGFTDLDTKNAGLPHEYAFTFEGPSKNPLTDPVTVSKFSVHMLDFGDLNMPLSLPPVTNHYAIIEAFNAGGTRVAFEELSYTTPAIRNPRESSKYGDLRINGDAVSAPHGMPGNWTWDVAGTGITRIVLRFTDGYDPNIAFTKLVYSIECP